VDDLLERLIGEIQAGLNESQRMVMEHRADAALRGLAEGVARASARLNELASEIGASKREVEVLRGRLGRSVPDNAILDALSVPRVLGSPGERLRDVLGVDDESAVA
jgi:hypothetical protein